MAEHIAKAFDTDLEELNRMVAEMGGLAEKEIADAVHALTRRDLDVANRLIASDAQIDALQREIEERAILTIARRQPMAVDLREVVSALRVANEIERIGDLAKNIGKRALDLEGEYPSLKLIRGVDHMGGLVLTQLKRVLDAYAARDVEEAMDVWKRDDEIDAMCVSLFRELLTYMMEDPRNITFCIHLLFSAKNIERIGDLAKNIGKRALDLDGEYPSLKLIRGVDHMGGLVLTQLKRVLDAYAARDVEEAMDVWKRDEEIDAMCVSLFRELLTYMMEDPRNITFCIHLLFSAKNIERMGDHATNIAETVYYMIKGEPIISERTCKWPNGDPLSEEFSFCGNDCADTGPYCGYHSRIAFQPAAERRRSR